MPYIGTVCPHWSTPRTGNALFFLSLTAQYTVNTVNALKIHTTKQWTFVNCNQLNLKHAIKNNFKIKWSLRTNILKICFHVYIETLKCIKSSRYLVCSAMWNFTKYPHTWREIKALCIHFITNTNYYCRFSNAFIKGKEERKPWRWWLHWLPPEGSVGYA